MSEPLATSIVQTVAAYLGAGLVVALPFVLAGVQRIDPVAREATRGFRAIIVPGVVLFWPLLLWRLATGAAHPPRERNAHRRRAAGGPR